MTSVKWTKTYELSVDSRLFRVFVSEHDNLGYHASCLWYEKQRVLRAPDQTGALEFKLEQQHASTEEDALTALMSWVYSRFQNVGELKLVQA